MTSRSRKSIAVLLAVAALSGCANMTPQQRNTAVGAAVGAVAGSVLTGGNSVGTIGGATVGGIIGNQVRY